MDLPFLPMDYRNAVKAEARKANGAWLPEHAAPDYWDEYQRDGLSPAEAWRADKQLREIAEGIGPE